MGKHRAWVRRPTLQPAGKPALQGDRAPPAWVQPVSHPKKQRSLLGDPGLETGGTSRYSPCVAVVPEESAALWCLVPALPLPVWVAGRGGA